MDDPQQVHSFFEFERLFGGISSSSQLGFSVRAFFDNGGQRAIIVRFDPSEGASSDYIGNIEHQTGLYALEKVKLFNLLCFLPAGESNLTSTRLNEVMKYCEGHRAMVILDPLSTWCDVGDVTKGYPIPGLVPSPNAAIYFPNLEMPNPLRKNQMDTIKPSGAIAGVYARIDASHGVWKAPAGTNASLKGVTALSTSLDDTENGVLNALGINCLRSFPNHGPLVWGARTMVGDDQSSSPWKYISVRRTALYLEHSIEQGTEWVVFEPNDEPLWAQLRQNIDVFMHSLFRQGAFSGSTASEAYFVKCDNETTTPDDIQKGLVNIVIGFAPLKPAEFVILKIQQKVMVEKSSN